MKTNNMPGEQKWYRMFAIFNMIALFILLLFGTLIIILAFSGCTTTIQSLDKKDIDEQLWPTMEHYEAEYNSWVQDLDRKYGEYDEKMDSNKIMLLKKSGEYEQMYWKLKDSLGKEFNKRLLGLTPERKYFYNSDTIYISNNNYNKPDTTLPDLNKTPAEIYGGSVPKWIPPLVFAIMMILFLITLFIRKEPKVPKKS